MRPFVVGGLAFVLLLGGCSQGCGYKPALKASQKDVTFTVAHKERGSDNRPYLVFTSDERVYSIEDSFWLWKFDASDRYARIHAGRSYRCTTAGWRIRFLSAYENLIECAEAPAS